MKRTLVLPVCISLLCTITPAFAQEADGESFEARIDRIQQIPCSDGSDGCARVNLTGTSGPFRSESIVIETAPDDELGARAPVYAAGDRVIVQTHMMNGQRQYFISDTVRRTPLLWLGALFIAAVAAFGGMKALRSFAGLVVSFAVLLLFMLPRILAGNSPVAVAMTGSLIIMMVTFVLSHGWNRKTAAAFGGTAGSLIVTSLLAAGFSVYAKLTGTADEEMLFLLQEFPNLNTTGILLAGIMIGSLGVLDDITIAQSSAVFELRSANPRWSVRDLYASACRIGADHIAAAVNTLVLAYAGTSLPLLLLLIAEPVGETWWTFLNREMIATEIIRTLVGSIGLLAAVPLTTYIAAVLAVRSHPTTANHRGHAH